MQAFLPKLSDTLAHALIISLVYIKDVMTIVKITNNILYRTYTSHVRTFTYLFSDTPMYSRDSSVGTATSYGLDDRRFGDRVPVGARIFSSPRRPDRLSGPHILLSNGYRGLFPRG
jgi:hypothetical protein